MLRLLLAILQTVCSSLRSRRRLVLENLALRQQLAMLRRSVKRARVSPFDCWFWVLFSEQVVQWRIMLHSLHPDTVVRWHRNRFRCYWHLKSRPRREGRPSVAPEIRKLIRQMQAANVGRGAPRIRGELFKLGIDISQATVSKYMVRRRAPPSQTWRTFLNNHAEDLATYGKQRTAVAGNRRRRCEQKTENPYWRGMLTSSLTPANLLQIRNVDDNIEGLQ